MQEKAWTAQQLNGIQLPVYRHSWRVVAFPDGQALRAVRFTNPSAWPRPG